jgi:hypothetical protein
MVNPFSILLSTDLWSSHHSIVNLITKETVALGMQVIPREQFLERELSYMGLHSGEMSQANAYLAVVDTENALEKSSPSEHLDLMTLRGHNEFREAVNARLPIGIIVLESAATGAGARINRGLKDLRDIYNKNRSEFLLVRRVRTIRRAEIRTLLSQVKANLQKRVPRVDAAIPQIPNQSMAPVRVEERNGLVSLVSDKDSELSAIDRDFDAWREPVTDHINELLLGDFQIGTNHSRLRERLVALATLLSGSIPNVKERQFRIGYEIERQGKLIAAYRSGADDMPSLNAAVLEDLDYLHTALLMGSGKLERWSEFHRAATADPLSEGCPNPDVVSTAVDKMAVEMEVRQKYFDPGLPQTFRFLAEAARDPLGATKAIVFGTVKSAENVLIFLGQRALSIGKRAVEAAEQHISKAVAASLLVSLSGAALEISGALPTAWAWLRPLLNAIANVHVG